MSLSSQLVADEVKAILRTAIKNPGLRPKPPARVPWKKEAYNPWVGVALDYAMRFGLEARFDATTRETLAANTMWIVTGNNAFDGYRKRIGEGYSAAKEVVAEADFGAHALSEETARACLELARVDTLYRSPPAYIETTLSKPIGPVDVEQVQGLFSIVPWEDFRPSERLVLNPLFNQGSELIGGADGDIVIVSCPS